MNRPRDRTTAKGLLPLMEARPWKDGKTVTYRYHPIGGKPENLGTDRDAAIRKVLSMTKAGPAAGTIKALWDAYQTSNDWKNLGDRTKQDYKAYSVEILKVFDDTLAADITAPLVSRYLRKERKTAPVRANREVSLLGNLISYAIDQGEAEHNPCRGGQVKRNKEMPRTEAPERSDIDKLIEFAAKKGGRSVNVMMIAEFSALAGSRKAEFLGLHWPQVGETEIRLMRAKQRNGAQRVEKIAISPALQDLLTRLRAVATNDSIGAVFPTRNGNPYTDTGFNAMWRKFMLAALGAGVITRHFTFHDLRAHYVTLHKTSTGELPDMHASPTTTARVYERSKVSRRKSL